MMQEVAQEVQNMAKEAINNVHTALPAKVVSFDTSKGTATIQPYGQIETSKNPIDYPQVTEVPIVTPYCEAAGCGVAIPIKVGDCGMLLISEIELDGWRKDARSSGSLKYSLTSGVFIPGLMRQATGILQKACQTNAVVIGTADTNICIGDGSITVNGNLVVTGDVRAGGVSLKGHTHTSGEAGSQTSTPK